MGKGALSFAVSVPWFGFCTVIDTSFQSTKIPWKLCVLPILPSRFSCCCASVGDGLKRRMLRLRQKSNLSDPHCRATTRSWILFEEKSLSHMFALPVGKQWLCFLFSIFNSQLPTGSNPHRKWLVSQIFFGSKASLFWGCDNCSDIILKSNSWGQRWTFTTCVSLPCISIESSCTSVAQVPEDRYISRLAVRFLVLGFKSFTCIYSIVMFIVIFFSFLSLPFFTSLILALFCCHVSLRIPLSLKK